MRKDRTLIGLKTLIKKTDNTSTIKRPGSGRPQRPTFTSVADRTC